MPQGKLNCPGTMPKGKKKVPFSGKQKKEQLAEKRKRKQDVSNFGDNEQHVTKSNDRVEEPEEESKIIVKDTSQIKVTNNDYMVDVNFSSSNTGRQKYDLLFQKESKEEIMKNKEMVRKPLKMVDPKELEMDIDQLFPETCDYPSRPTWDSKMSKDQVESNEAKYFRKYVNDVMTQNEQNLSYFELNLETWRQLWRVSEMADVLLLVVDSRFPSAMVPPSLIVNLAPKPVILVLNKIDLISPELALAWRTYFTEKFSNVKKVTFFTSYPAYNLRKQPYAEEQGQPGLQGKKLRGRILMAKEGAIQIVDAVNECILDLNEKVDIDSWREKIEKSVPSISSKDIVVEEESVKKIDEENKAIITLGMIGAPNAGKSSLINSLMGKVVVSVSKTPGHTKHFQTIFITPSVKLVDCPGLVFPSVVPKRLQVILGSFPIAQTRDPLSVVQYLAERIDLPSILKLELPKDRSRWTTYDICEAFAYKRGFVTARSNRPDTSRAANLLLRFALEGRLSLHLKPPAFNQEHWKNHEDLAKIKEVVHTTLNSVPLEEELLEEEDDEYSEEDEIENQAIASCSNKFKLLHSDE